jgi:hypothetical protein
MSYLFKNYVLRQYTYFILVLQNYANKIHVKFIFLLDIDTCNNPRQTFISEQSNVVIICIFEGTQEDIRFCSQ